MGCSQQALWAQLPWSSAVRQDQLLDGDWLSAVATGNTDSRRYDGFEQPGYDLSDKGQDWQRVQLPHNWDDYGGYIREKHGNLHGDGWYRKRFKTGYKPGQAYFLFFEGVGSYATVYLNGHLVGKHAGGRTSFNLEVTRWLHKDGTDNLLAVKAEHPAGIRDLPWVCGGCSDEVGFSEGSQPLGIFRPVHLIRTGKVRIIPFGVHIYNDTTVSEQEATLQVATTIKTYAPASAPTTVRIRQILVDRTGKQVAMHSTVVKARAGINGAAEGERTVHGQLMLSGEVHLWSLKNPYLYTLKTTVTDNRSGVVLDELETPYGIRWIKWPALNKTGPKQFLLNGKPVYINGIAGYEHALGNSHAFTKEEIASRVAMIRSMGFNAFRDAHQPHNLRFQYYWDKDGILWWPQFSAHIWFDTPAFRKNFLQLLKDWVMERRNSPSNIMWGLQNESQLPEDFAKECVALIRRLDPTASSQRLITTCNGGQGTDWDVPQNWSGTYGGDPDQYDEDLKKEVLVGEYGGWRTMDLHSEGGYHEKGAYSIESWTALMEKKIRLAWQVRDSVCGQFLWLFNSHDNPGREQAGEGFRDLDKIGPVNYKGLLTSWEEPTEAVYLYQSNFTNPATAPMVHIASHNWSGRWHTTREAKDIIVYSNCDSVRLYNGVARDASLIGTRTRNGVGTHFTWKQVRLSYNLLYAVGYYKGKAVVDDQVQLSYLPPAPEVDVNTTEVVTAASGYRYLYRYNVGGPAYTDHLGNKWAPDRARTDSSYGARSWTADYKGMPPFFASQRSIPDPIEDTREDALFQTFRYGRQKLDFVFPVPDGDYRVELYFAEPWWGVGSHLDCSGWRQFDVAVNGEIRLAHFDIFKQAGPLRALKKVIYVQVKGGRIRIDFPRNYSGQAIISAIAIATKDRNFKKHTLSRPAASGSPAGELKAFTLQQTKAPIALLSPVVASGTSVGKQSSTEAAAALNSTNSYSVADWLDTHTSYNGSTLLQLGATSALQSVYFTGLPASLYGAQWLQRRPENNRLRSRDVVWIASAPLDLYVAIPSGATISGRLLEAKLIADGFSDTHTHVSLLIGNTDEAGRNTEDSLTVYKKRLAKGDRIQETSWWNRSLIAFKAASNMQPAYDQKKEISCDLSTASYSKGGRMGQRAGKQAVFFSPGMRSSDTGQDSISWPVVTGVANFHSFHIKYAVTGKDSVLANLKLFASDGKLMAASTQWLTNTKEGKWNNVYLVTPTMINAGRYRLVVSWEKSNEKVYMYSLKFR